LTVRRPALLVLLLFLLLTQAACSRLSPAPVDPGVNLGDPEVGGGAGEEAGPETPVPLPTATREGSPRLDAAAAATIGFPPTPTALAADQSPAAPADEEQQTIDGGQPATPESTTAPVSPTATPAEPEPAVTPTPEGERTHVVKAGENLYRIGLQYGLSWTAIAEYNGITDPNQIAAGQELRIPPSPTATPTADAGATTDDGQPLTAAGRATTDDRPQATAGQSNTEVEGVTIASGEGSAAVGGRPSAVVSVSPGDTLYSISERYGVSWAQVAEANGLETPNQLYPGQMLKIPPDVPGPNPEFAHRVHRGDTLAALAQQYGLPLDALADANGLQAPFVLYPGQMLVIPAGDE